MVSLDHTEDRSGSELFRIQQVYPLPEFVKNADLNETMRPENLPATVYADDVGRHYPCHTAASTWLSAAYFAEKQGSLPARREAVIRHRLEKFAEYWGIKPAVARIWSQREKVKQASDDSLPDSDFAVVYVDDAGRKDRFCRIKSASDLVNAADWLHRYRDTLPFNDRCTVARKIMKKANDLGASLGQWNQFIEKQAGYGLCDPEEVRAMLRDRAKLAFKQEQKEAILKLAELLEDKPRSCFEPGTLTKLAEVIDGFDRAIGLSGRYTPSIPRPEEVLFKVSLSEAKEAADHAVTLTTGRVYDCKQFKKLALEDLRSLFGNDLANEVADGLDVDPVKLGEMAETMPRPDAETFEKLLAEAGIPPVR